jgi:hypothetical protein
LFNGSTINQARASTQRTFGRANFYLSSRWYKPANASIRNVKMTQLPLNTCDKLLTDEGLLAEIETCESEIDIPKDYIVRFLIRPLSIVKNWANIFHVSNQQQDTPRLGGRMPAVWFIPKTLQLSVKVGTRKVGDAGVDVKHPLPLNTFTNVTLSVIKETLKVYFNNTMVESVPIIGDRASGPAYLFFSSPWYSSARAVVKTFSISSESAN